MSRCKYYFSLAVSSLRKIWHRSGSFCKRNLNWMMMLQRQIRSIRTWRTYPTRRFRTNMIYVHKPIHGELGVFQIVTGSLIDQSKTIQTCQWTQNQFISQVQQPHANPHWRHMAYIIYNKFVLKHSHLWRSFRYISFISQDHRLQIELRRSSISK